MKNKFEKETDKLKEGIVKKYGKRLDYPTDCELLVIDVMKKTGRRISSSTLKRMFNFVKRSSNFSKHSYDTLSIYVGFEDWDDFLNLGKTRKQPELTNDLWIAIKTSGERITKYNLKSIKDYCGTNYGKIAHREFAEKHYYNFLNSDKPITAMIAPGGYGKSITVANLTENFINSRKKKYQNDILMLIDAGVIKNLLSKDYTIITWLLEQMGYDSEKDLYGILYNNPQYRLGKLILIIDGIDAFNTDKKLFTSVVDNLLSILSLIVGIDWFKVVITFRPETWIRFTEAIGDNKSLQNAWYKGNFSQNFNDVINMPLLEESELEETYNNYDIGSFSKLRFSTPELLPLLKHPSILQLYLNGSEKQQFEQQINLLTAYIKETMLSGKFSKGKLEFINCFIKQTNSGVDKDNLLKEQIETDIVKCEQAYNELVSYGFIYELDELDKYLVYKQFVRFADNNLLSFFIANAWLRENEMDDKLIQKIIKHYKNSEIIYLLLNWIIVYAFYESKTDVIKDIYKYIEEIHKNESIKNSAISDNNSMSDTLSLIVSEIRKYNNQNELVQYFAQDKISRELYFRSNYDIDFIVPQFSKSIDSFLEFSKDKSDKVFSHSIKLLSYVYSSNKDAALDEYKTLMDLKPNQLDIPVVSGLSFAAQIGAQNMQGDIKKTLLDAIIKNEKQILNSNKPKQEIIQFYLWIMDALNIAKQYEFILKLSKSIFTTFKGRGELNYAGDFKMLKCYKANALLVLGDEKKAKNEFEEINPDMFSTNRRNYLIIQHNLIKANFFINEEKIDDAELLINSSVELAQIMQLSFLEEKAKELKNSEAFEIVQ